MEIEIKSNKLCNEAQIIKLDNSVLTLIGENGCGKSSILEAIFEQNLKQNDKTVVCFSSGQNESFSDSYMSFVNKARNIINIKDDGSNLLALDEIKTFYFDYDWSKFLIFFASVLKKKGLTHSFLKGKYINSTDSDGDISSSLTFPIQVQEVYINRINEALKKEETEPEIPTLRKTTFHNQLSKLIEIKINPDFDFDKPLKKTTINLSGADIIKFYKKESLSIFQFLSIAANNSFFIDIHESKLKFKNNLNLNALSDGEYQLLVINSLIDLFDDNNAILLLDEIDSHLHYKSINSLWCVLKNQIKGKIITTTHISDSILQNDYNDIRLIQRGKIEQELTLRELATRLSDLTGIENFEFQLAARTKNIVLIDHEDDWIIFKKLAAKKLDEDTNLVFCNIIPFQRTSSYQNETEIFGKSKLKFVSDFKEQLNGKSIETKRFFLICDRDNLSTNSIANDLQVQIHRDFKSIKSVKEFNVSLLAWRRREIENYLLSYSMLKNKGALETIIHTFPLINFKTGINLDGCADIEQFDAKELLHPLYKSNGFNETELTEIISLIPKEEISEDIVKMYNFLKQNII